MVVLMSRWPRMSTGAAAEQEQAAEGDRVGVHHPLQAGAGEAERLLDVREGHVHDGGVGNADSIVAPRCPSIRIVYKTGLGSMPPWLRAGR
jgi:hypothetical protein